jgi:putative (di)nucleoside polyphosphate hydrolase
MPKSEALYQANVAAILRNARGRILVCERLEPRGAWQFPQGGVDPGETHEQAIRRELWEEIGVSPSAIRIVDRRGPYRYLFERGREKKGFHGKEQLYFLVEFAGEEAPIDVDTKHPEFRDFRWIAPEEFRIKWLPSMKREVYRAVFRDFFAIKL